MLWLGWVGGVCVVEGFEAGGLEVGDGLWIVAFLWGGGVFGLVG